MSKHRKSAGRGALVILGLMLASSGALRVGSGVGEALALTADSANAPPIEAVAVCPEMPAALAEALSGREAQVAAQEAALVDRMSAVALANQAIDQRMADLAIAETELTEALAMADGAAESDLTHLTSMYEAMKPKDAAALFDSMAPEFAAGFLGRMQPEVAAPVLAGMSPEIAYAVSVLLAGRNALVPTK